MTDAELICQARANNPEAWNTLSQRFLPLVWRYAYALLQDTHAVEDVVSEAMLAFLKGIEQIDADTAKISAWLRSVVRHKVADYHRRNYRVKDHFPHVSYAHQQRDGVPEPLELMLVTEKRKRIAGILAGLPERQRLALEWKYVDGLRVREISERLGETEKSIEATLYRARREFRRLYEAAVKFAESEMSLTSSSSPGSDEASETA